MFLAANVVCDVVSLRCDALERRDGIVGFERRRATTTVCSHFGIVSIQPTSIVLSPMSAYSLLLVEGQNISVVLQQNNRCCGSFPQRLCSLWRIKVFSPPFSRIPSG